MALVGNTSARANRLTARQVCTFSSQSLPVDREQHAKVIFKPNNFASTQWSQLDKSFNVLRFVVLRIVVV